MIRFSLHNKGVGLVEGIVAIAILVTGIISVVSLSISNLSASESVEARLVAVNLAREGVEAVRSIRDGNWLKGYANETAGANAWDTGLTSLDTTDKTAIPVLNADTLAWSLDFTPNDFSSSATKLRRNQTRKLYRQSVESAIPAGETITPYSRLITIYSICRDALGTITNNNVTCLSGTKIGLRVISRVEWTESGRTSGLDVEEWLYNWRYSFTPYVP